MNKFRKYAATVMALALVLCIGYFSFMSPTSAWFYESGVIDSGDSFVFGDVSVNTDYITKKNVVFVAATKFADPDETLFDDVINIEEIYVKNSGTVPARIYANVKNTGSLKGLKWFYFTDDMLVDSSVKKTIENTLPELTKTALDYYNTGDSGRGGHYIILQPGEETTVKIATWIEYDYVKTALSEGRTLNGYDMEISLIAAQDKDNAVER